MSVFISGYKGILCFLRWMRKSNDALNAFIAGAIGGLGILFDTNESRRIMIALYTSTRSLHFLSRYLWRHYVSKYVSERKYIASGEQVVHAIHNKEETPVGLSKRLMSPLPSETSSVGLQQAGRLNEIQVKSVGLQQAGQLQQIIDDVQEPQSPSDDVKHPVRAFIRQLSGTLVMMLSSSRILYAFIAEPDTLTPSYLSFLLTHGGIRTLFPTHSRKGLDLFSGMIQGTTSGENNGRYISTDLAQPLASRLPQGMAVDKIVPFEKYLGRAPNSFMICSLQHPHTTSCWSSVVWAFSNEWWRALKLYTPLNIVVLFKLVYDTCVSLSTYYEGPGGSSHSYCQVIVAFGLVLDQLCNGCLDATMCF